MKTKHRIIAYLVLIISIMIIFGPSSLFQDIAILSSPERVQKSITDLGSLSFFGYILLTTLSVPLPIPSTTLVITGGFLFGTIYGFLLALVSIIFGSVLSFYLGRWYGKPLVEKIVDDHHLSHLYHIFKKRGKTAIIISYLVPLFPSDTVSLFLGLTPLSFKEFFPLLIITHLPRLFLIIYAGNSIRTGLTPTTLISVGIASLLILVALFREPIKKAIFSELRTLKKGSKGVSKR